MKCTCPHFSSRHTPLGWMLGCTCGAMAAERAAKTPQKAKQVDVPGIVESQQEGASKILWKQYSPNGAFESDSSQPEQNSHGWAKNFRCAACKTVRDPDVDNWAADLFRLKHGKCQAAAQANSPPPAWKSCKAHITNTRYYAILSNSKGIHVRLRCSNCSVHWCAGMGSPKYHASQLLNGNHSCNPSEPGIPDCEVKP